MRTLAIIIGMTVIVTCAQAQAPAPQAPGSASPAPPVSAEVTKIDRSITLELNDMPIPEALNKMFNNSTYYMTENAWRILRDYQVNLKLKNAVLEDALKAILQDHACFVKEGDIYTIMTPEEYKNYTTTGQLPPAAPPGYSYGGYGTVSSQFGSAPRVARLRLTRVDRLSLPAMPVADAYKALTQSVGGTDLLGWKFGAGLGKRMMPGVKLQFVPLDMAAEMIVVAAGLVPPSGPDGDVKARAKGSPGYTFRISDQWSSSSMAGYKDQNGAWRHILKNFASPVASLLRDLFDHAGVNYYIATGDSGADGKSGSKIVSVQMVDMTLGEILDTLLPPVGLTYTKKGDVVIVKPAGPGGSTGAKAAPSKGTVSITEPDPEPLPPTKPIANIPGSQAPGDVRGF